MGFATQSSAQLRFGAGLDALLSTPSTIGVQGKVLYKFSDEISGNGSFSYYISDFFNWSLDVGAQYLLVDGESLKVSPLVGLDILNGGFSIAGFGVSATTTNLQLGAFLELPLGGMNVYLEPKLVLGSGNGLVVAGGIMF